MAILFPPLPPSFLPSPLPPPPSSASSPPTVEFREHPQDVTANLGDINIRLHFNVSDGNIFNWEHYLLNGTRWNIVDNRSDSSEHDNFYTPSTISIHVLYLHNMFLSRGFTIDPTNGDLLIAVVQSFHAGLYSCYANRASCSEESNNATFIINGVWTLSCGNPHSQRQLYSAFKCFHY